jgi:predicted metalloprotease with PDZ domain
LGKDYAFVSPAGVLGWVPGFENRKMLLTVKPPQEWKRATLHCAPPTKDGTVQAGDYFELIDSPFVIGENLTVETRSVGKGKEVVTVGFGKPELKLGPIADLLADLAKENEKLFGENPVDRFVLLCDFDGFASGLEHRASSRVGLWSTSPQQVQGLISHEYFHIFNIKRIRPKGIGPLDLTQPAKTPSLWFAEGVTDYYAEVILTRLGRQTKQEFLKGMATMLQRFQQRRSRSQATAIESSLRVWEVKGSQGYGISYYEVGWLIGATLDLAIRRESKQKFSLDDVMRALYKSHKRPDGFTEVELRQICTTYGGPQLGEIYDDCVNSTGSPPLGQELRSAGYTWNGRDLVAPEETRHKYPYDLRSP